MSRILILAFSNLDHDARVMRQVNFLKASHKVTVICYGGTPDPTYEIISVKRLKLTWGRKIIASLLLLSRNYSLGHQYLYNYQSWSSLIRTEYDLVIANDIESLPLAFKISPTNVVFDAHEYAPRHFEDKMVWRIFFQGLNKFLCKTYLPRVKAMTTVGTGLARAYEENYHVKAQVITNAAPYFELAPRPLSDNGNIRLVHHGGANPSRRLEVMMDMVALLDERFTLDMILITPPIANKKTKKYLDELKRKAKANGRVRILPALKSSEIIPFINQYDMGVFLLPPVNFNYENTLPNKLFDFIQARLAIAIGPTPEMKSIVREFNIGVISEEFTAESLAKEINSLTNKDIWLFKLHTSQAAKELNAEKNQIAFLQTINQLLK